MAQDVDGSVENQDWLKHTWDLPPYKSEAFIGWLDRSGGTLKAFRKLPVYRMAVEQGLIVNDEWEG